MPMPKLCAGKTILLIEDDNAMLTVIQTELTKAGACVLIAENGQRGLEVALQEHPDLISLDLLMPVLLAKNGPKPKMDSAKNDGAGNQK